MDKRLIQFFKENKIKFKYRSDSDLRASLLLALYKSPVKALKRSVFKLFYHFQGRHHQFYSQTIRTLFKKFHNVTIGLYSHGACFLPGAIPPDTTVGRYCSFAHGFTVHDANHPIDTKSSHAFFFNPRLGVVDELTIPITQLNIGNDVWTGQNVIILPGCSQIGDGAVIGAGSVVNKNIPPYSIAIGNPARVVGFRFSKEKIEELLEEKWWEKEIYELKESRELFSTPLEKKIKQV